MAVKCISISSHILGTLDSKKMEKAGREDTKGDL